MVEEGHITRNFLIALLVIVVVVLLLLYIKTPTTPSEQKSTLSVQGTSELTYDPDQATAYLGVSILKPNANDAQTESNKIINAIIDSLNDNGISEKDIETENLNLYEEKVYIASGYESNGWRANQNLKIKTKDFSKVGLIVDLAVKAGANQINNIAFGLSPEKEKEYKQDSIEDATKTARDKATVLAKSSGAKLKGIISISESGFYIQPYLYNMAGKGISTAVSESTRVLPKDVTVTSTVNIVYEIK